MMINKTKHLSFLIIISILFSFSQCILVNATNINILTNITTANRQITPNKELDTIVNLLIKTKNSNLTINSYLPFYDENQNIVAWGYIISPIGYVIIDNNNNNLIEYSFENKSPFNKNEKIYFTGPLDYYTKENNNFTNIISNEKITKTEFNQASQKFIAKSKNIVNLNKSPNIDISTSPLKTEFNQFSQNFTGKSKNIVNLNKFANIHISKSPLKSAVKTTTTINGPAAITDCKISYNPRTDFHYNPDGICGSTAASIFLMYYEDHLDSNMVPSGLTSNASDGKSLTLLLKPHIDGTVNGSSIIDVKDGLNWYFKYRKISDQYSATAILETKGSSTVYNKIKSIINKDRPIQLSVTDHPIYHSHEVLAYGYEKVVLYSSVVYEHAIVNNGWGENNIMISRDYIRGCAYINEK